MKKITTRNELPMLIPQHGKAVELGVAKGLFSEIILASSPTCQLYSVDRWTDHHDEAEFEGCKERLSKYAEQGRSYIVRNTFATAVHMFDDGFFDFIYIDGYAHTGQDDGKTLRLWYPKLKKGGIFAGHDFHRRYQQTIDIVTKFCALQEKEFKLTEMDVYPSWWFRK